MTETSTPANRFDRIFDTRPLRSSRHFRRLWISSSASGFGHQMTVVAVLFQVWQLTGSPFWTGVVGLANAIPMIVFGLVGGSLADHVDRRKLVLLTTTGGVVTAVLLALQAVAGFDSLPLILVLVGAQAGCAALGAPARRTFVPRLLPRGQVAAGIALTNVSFQASMLVGPAIAGLTIGWQGVAACYVVDAFAYLVSFYGVARLPAQPPDRTGTTSRRPGIRDIVDGGRFIAGRPVLRGSLLTDVIATVMAMPVSLFPVVNEERFGGDPRTLGLFLTAIAVGGITAGLTSGTVTRYAHPGRIMLVAATTWGVALTGFGLAGPNWLALGCLAVAGAADTLSVISRGTIVQLATPDAYRGRVSSVELAIGAGGPDIGNFRGGVVAGLTSAPVALVSGGLLCVVGVGIIALRNSAVRRFTVTSDDDNDTSA